MRWNLIVFISLVLLVLVIPHIVNADTLLVYPESDTCDEQMAENTNAIWSTIRNDVGDVNTDLGLGGELGIWSTTTTEQYDKLSRAGFSFNTSSIGSSSTIDSAKFSIFYHTTAFTGLGAQKVGITGFSPASDTNFVAGDYDSFGNTRYSTDQTPTPFARQNFTLNSDGLSAIDKSGYTTLMMRYESDIDNSNSTLTWGSDLKTYNRLYEYSDATRQPFLEIVYTPEGAGLPVAAFIADHTSVCQQDPIQFTDQSTNTPTGWYWDFGDTSTNTTQNPVYRYSTNGLFTVKLQATNEFGFDWENKTNYIGVGDWGECVDQGETCQA